MFRALRARQRRSKRLPLCMLPLTYTGLSTRTDHRSSTFRSLAQSAQEWTNRTPISHERGCAVKYREPHFSPYKFLVPQSLQYNIRITCIVSISVAVLGCAHPMPPTSAQLAFCRAQTRRLPTIIANVLLLAPACDETSSASGASCLQKGDVPRERKYLWH